MSKYDGIKNPNWTDEEFEAWERQTWAEATASLERSRHSMEPGDFLGYWCCPTCHDDDNPMACERQDMIRPAIGDLEMVCPNGHRFVYPLVQGPATVTTEGSPL